MQKLKSRSKKKNYCEFQGCFHTDHSKWTFNNLAYLRASSFSLKKPTNPSGQEDRKTVWKTNSVERSEDLLQAISELFFHEAVSN